MPLKIMGFLVARLVTDVDEDLKPQWPTQGSVHYAHSGHACLYTLFTWQLCWHFCLIDLSLYSDISIATSPVDNGYGEVTERKNNGEVMMS